MTSAMGECSGSWMNEMRLHLDIRDEAAAHREKARAEVVDQKLKVVEDVAKALVPPESMSSFKVGK